MARGPFGFGLFNPVVRTMRGLCEATKLGRVQREISKAYVSLGSFSEAQAVFAPEVLEEVLKELGAEVARRGQTLSGIKPAQWQALIIDSSLFRALPRMAWALWRHQGVRQCAVRLHVKYDLSANAAVERLIAKSPAGRNKRPRLSNPSAGRRGRRGV